MLLLGVCEKDGYGDTLRLEDRQPALYAIAGCLKAGELQSSERTFGSFLAILWFVLAYFSEQFDSERQTRRTCSGFHCHGR